MASYAELALRISADIKDFEKKMNTMTGKFKSMSQQALPASRAVAGGLLAVGAAAIGLSGKAVTLAAEIEQVEVAFSTLLGSGEAAQDMIEGLQDFAASTPFQFPGLADAARSLVAFGIEAEDTIPTLRRIGDVAAGIGAPIGDIAEIYGKARVQGRLFAEDINQLTGRGIPIIGELATQFGVAESEVRKLVESGQVNFGHLEEAFKSLTSEGGKFEGLMEAQSQTVAGKWSTLKDNVGLTLTSLGQTIIETFDLKDVIDRAIEFMANIRISFEGFAAKVEELGLKEALAQIFSEETKMKMILIAGAITGALVPAIYAFASSVIAATVPLLPFIAAGTAIAGLAYLIYKNWDGIQGKITEIWHGMANTIRRYANNIIGIVNNLIRALNGINIKIPDWVPGIGGKKLGFNIKELDYMVNTSVSAFTQGKEAFNSSLLNSGAAISAGSTIQAFDKGGIVPGPRGVPRLILAHGGETVLPTHKTGMANEQRPMIGTVNITAENPSRAKYEYERLQRNLAIEWGLA